MKQQYEFTPNSPELQIAADWWTDILRTGAKQDAGDPMINMAYAICADKSKITDEQLDTFRQTFCRNWLESDPFHKHVLDVDYDPCRLLEKSAEDAGITVTMISFPIKTVMWLDPGYVRVKYGYRAPIEILYARMFQAWRSWQSNVQYDDYMELS